MVEIRKVIAGSEYDFLETNEHLRNKMLFLTFGGSHAYGTNVETSDIDVRGCAINSLSDLLGLTNFEQVVDEKTDTTIYSFNKLVQLMSNCNPNTIEMIGGLPESYIFYHPVGQDLVANKKMFLSRRAAYSFGGYAKQQLNRLENALARDRLSQADKERHILNSCQSAMMSFNERYKEFKEGNIQLFLDDSDKKDFDKEIFMNVNLTHYPVRDYKSLWSDLNNIIKDYGSLNHRNNKKDFVHLNKHAQHLIRLYYMALDILEKEEINTYRSNEKEFLLEIRNGKFQNEDGTYQQEFFDLVEALEKRLEYAKNNTSLPKEPNFKQLNEFVMECNKKFWNIS